jgi:glucose/arabinose dehydrogenase
MTTTRTLMLTASLALGAVPVAAQNIRTLGLPAQGRAAPTGLATPGRPLPVNPPLVPAQKPAFRGQTSAPAVVTRTPIAVEIKTQNLNHPWGLAFIGDGKLVVSEKPGTMRVIDMASGRPLAGVQGIPQVVYKGDAGLLDVVADPQFSQNRTLYFVYVEPRGENESGVVVAKARLDPPEEGGAKVPMYTLSNVTTIMRVHPGWPQNAHYGSRLLFDREGYLFVSLAERFYSPARDEAQSLYSWAGKILRVDTSGKAAPGNPFDRDQQAEDHYQPEIWSYGHRNPQALAINPVDGGLWDVEHGPDGGDEVNHVVRAANYGWPLVAYGRNYDGSAIYGGRTQMPATVQPRYVWEAAIGPGGASFYSGDLIPEWKNNLFVGAMAGEHLVRLVIDGDRIVGEERLLQDQRQRVRHVVQGPDGALWVITDEADGRLIRLAPR